MLIFGGRELSGYGTEGRGWNRSLSWMFLFRFVLSVMQEGWKGGGEEGRKEIIRRGQGRNGSRKNKNLKPNHLYRMREHLPSSRRPIFHTHTHKIFHKQYFTHTRTFLHTRQEIDPSSDRLGTESHSCAEKHQPKRQDETYYIYI